MRQSPPAGSQEHHRHDQQDEFEGLPQPGSARSDSVQLMQELEAAIRRSEIEHHDEREWMEPTNVQGNQSESERRITFLENHVSRLIDYTINIRDKLESLHQDLMEQIARNQGEGLRMDQFPVMSHLLQTALDGNECNLLRTDLDQVKIHVAISVCADVELRQLLCKFDIELPALNCLTFINYQQEVAAAADDMENRAQNTATNHHHRNSQTPTRPRPDGHALNLDQLQNAFSSESDDNFLVPQLLCLDFGQSAIVPSFVGFSPCSPNADAYYSMWLARNILFGRGMAYRSEIYFRLSNETT